MPCWIASSSELGYPLLYQARQSRLERRRQQGAAIARSCGRLSRRRPLRRRVLVERGVDARELECGVLGNEDPLTSVVGEIVPGAEFYDYRAKYLDAGSRRLIPADIATEIADEVRRLAVRRLPCGRRRGIGAGGLLPRTGTQRVFLNEMNTMPGFTQISMYPKLWEASGVSFAELVDRLVELGLERFAERARNETSTAPDP